MANWDEDSGYYCLLIAILCNLDVYESILMYKYGPDYPLCQKILKKKVRIENTDKMTDDEVGEMMYRLRKAGYTLEEISNAFLIQKAEENPAFSMQVLQKHKTIQKCMNYIMEQAYSIAQKEHEKRVNGKQPVTGREQNVALGISEIQVYQWAEDYYALDDAKQEADKKEKEHKKRISKQKKSVQQNGKKKTSVKTSPTIPAKNLAPAPAKKKKEENIQLSMFDMMQLDNE